jgi:hypothetical protein
MRRPTLPRIRLPRPKARVTALLFIFVGGSLVAAGIGMVSVPAGLVLAGMELAYVGLFVDFERGQRSAR